ncbi:MAG TPA: hypothetical protein VNK05_16990 [Chloroflexota bacterium]|nr:hypothetical protein [Chloroflexota bacterium]
MSSVCSITTAANAAPVASATGEGRMVFTVTNTTGRAVRLRARVVAEDAAAEPWLGLLGDDPGVAVRELERPFPPDGVQTLTVRLRVPPQTPPGTLRARLDVWDVEDPSETLTPGPTVAFEVPSELPVAPEPEFKDGYLTTLIAAAAGGLGAALVLGGAAALFGQAAIPRAVGRPPIRVTPTPAPGGVGGVIVGAIGEAVALAVILALAIVLGVVVGLWLGATLATWLTLRLRGFRGAGGTALLVALFLPILSSILIRLLSAVFGNEAFPVALGALLGLVLAALGARAIVVWRLSGRLRNPPPAGAPPAAPPQEPPPPAPAPPAAAPGTV